MTERWKQQVFEHHEPPPGGLAALRVRIDALETREHHNPRHALRWAAGLGAGALAVTVLALLITATRGQPDSTRTAAVSNDSVPAAELLADRSGYAHPGLIRYGLIDAPDAAITLAPAARNASAATRVPLDRADVTFYWISSTRPPEPVAEEAGTDLEN